MEDVFEVGRQAWLVAAREVAFGGEFVGELAPVRDEIGVAVDPHRRQIAPVIVGIHLERQAYAVEFAVDFDDLGPFRGTRQGGEEETRKEAQNRNDDEEFDQRERHPEGGLGTGRPPFQVKRDSSGSKGGCIASCRGTDSFAASQLIEPLRRGGRQDHRV